MVQSWGGGGVSEGKTSGASFCSFHAKFSEGNKNRKKIISLFSRIVDNTGKGTARMVSSFCAVN